MVSPFLRDSEMVEGVFINGEAMAYPVKMMDYHEIANDIVGGIPIALSYCPLTATGIGFDRRISAGTVQFGVSGLLCDNNLVMFDRTTESLWPQIGFQSVRGDLAGERLEQIQVFEMPWGAWKELHPDTEVVDFRALGNHINYDFYPYGTYFTTNAIFFPLRNVDSRLFPKERVHGIRAGGAAKVYPIDDMVNGGLLYDKWWKINSGTEPTTDFDPIWSSQTTNARTGADSWRCKECHGWDYVGKDGRYSSGSHYTGFDGVWTVRGYEKTIIFDSILDENGLTAQQTGDILAHAQTLPGG